MGRVFLATRIGQPGLKQLYAIKVIHERMVNDPQALAMMIDEANIASSLRHPNIVPVLELGRALERHFVVMEYVDGFPLHRLLKKNKSRRPARLIVPIMIDGLRGLHAAHELCDDEGRFLNLVHRDFSPDNLLVDIEGRCRVIDFGIAKIAARRMAQTQEGMQKGKLAYMSPEQLSSIKRIDRRADLWTAGVVLYEALTGVHPFRGPSDGATISAILRHDPDPPSSVGMKPPPFFDSVCMRALERSRDERLTTAEEMLEGLRSIALEHDLLGERSEIAEWVRRTFKKDMALRDDILQKLERAPQAEKTLLPVFPVSNISGSWDHSGSASIADSSSASSPILPPPDLPPPEEDAPPSAIPSPPSSSESRKVDRRVRDGDSPLRSGSVFDPKALGVDLSPRPLQSPRRPHPPQSPRGTGLLLIVCGTLIGLAGLIGLVHTVLTCSP